jgi:hypothetical protein
MARKAKEPGQKLFLLVWHDRPNTVIVGSQLKDVPDLVIPPGHKVVADNVWEGVAHFVRDVAEGLLHTEKSTVVPRNVELKVPAEYDSVLQPNQRELAKMICTTDSPLPQQVMENIQLHKLMGPGGVPKQGVKVTRKYLVENHRPFLQATVEMETSHRNRSEILSVLNDAIQKIDSL